MKCIQELLVLHSYYEKVSIGTSVYKSSRWTHIEHDCVGNGPGYTICYQVRPAIKNQAQAQLRDLIENG